MVLRGKYVDKNLGALAFCFLSNLRIFRLVVRSSFVFASTNCYLPKYIIWFILANHSWYLQKQMKIELLVEWLYIKATYIRVTGIRIGLHIIRLWNQVRNHSLRHKDGNHKSIQDTRRRQSKMHIYIYTLTYI